MYAPFRIDAPSPPRPSAKVPGLVSVSVGIWTFLLPYLDKGD